MTGSQRTSVRIAASAAAGILAVGLGFGLANVLAASGPGISSAIP